MCGLVGIIDLQGRQVDQSTVSRMTDVLRHRGPDNASVHVDGEYGLGHTRLSIIDVSDAANQPLWSGNRRYALVYNGELYNFVSLRDELKAAGLQFRTGSDSEVVLRAYEHWGRDCLLRMNGMFAFAIYDTERRRLFAARDRFGIKPFHYAIVNGRLFFASEIKALLVGFGSAPRVDTHRVLELLMYRELLRENLLHGVKTLAPGCVLTVDIGVDPEPIVEPWFHLVELPNHERASRLAEIPLEEKLDELDAELNAAVERHLVSDVPVGTLCSGGLDSSLVTAMICRTRPDTAVYHVDVRGISERVWAERVAAHLGIELNCVELTRESFLANYIDCIYYNDYPLTHANSVPIYLISSLARDNGCKVLLTGEGADELFGGYHWRYRQRRNFRVFTGWTRLLDRIRSRVMYLSTGIWSQEFDQEFSFRSRARLAQVVHFVADQEVRNQLEAQATRSYSFIRNAADRDIQGAMLADLWDYISGILHRQDRASMQASIESRVPFLDFELARFAANLPLRDKISWRESKILLKKLACRYLPNDVVYREKIGFGTPADDYVTSLPTGLFADGFLQQEFGFAPALVLDALRRDPGNFCHMLYGLEFWGRMFVWNEPPERLKEQWVA